AVPPDDGRRFGPDQSRGVRVHHRPDGLLSRLPLARRRRGSRPGDDACRRLLLDPDPDLQLCADPGVFLVMSAGQTPNIALAAGESLVIIGGSGTGKSVLIKCILGLMRPEAGSIRIDGEETVGLRRAGRERVMHKFGMLFQGSALFDSLSVWENVAFGLVQG